MPILIQGENPVQSFQIVFGFSSILTKSVRVPNTISSECLWVSGFSENEFGFSALQMNLGLQNLSVDAYSLCCCC